MRLCVAVFTWALLVAAGFAALYHYKATAGLATESPQRWPANTTVERATEGHTLVAFIHPHCSCSRATMAELARVLTESGTSLSARVLFLRPQGEAVAWTQTDMLDTARRLPRTQVLIDDNGVEATRFGAATSGAVLLYDAHGVLMFSGGLTALTRARGGQRWRAARPRAHPRPES